MTYAAQYDLLAALLNYPSAGDNARTQVLKVLWSQEHPEAAAAIEVFCAETRQLSTEEMEELFTRTFDYNPATSLEVGWHMFGEQYERGAFLVRMRQEMRRLELPESAELPDHLTHVLAVLGRIDDSPAAELAHSHVLPALELMIAGVKSLKSPYEHVLIAIRLMLESRFGPAGRTHIPLPVYQQADDSLPSEDRPS